MEDAVEWHGKAPNEEEYKQAILELDQQIRELRRMNVEGTDVGGQRPGGMALGMVDLSDPKWDNAVLDSFARNSLAQQALKEHAASMKDIEFEVNAAAADISDQASGKDDLTKGGSAK